MDPVGGHVAGPTIDEQMRPHAPTRIALTLIGLATVTACGDGLGPAGDLAVYVALSQDRVALGDTLELTGIAHNGGRVTIDAGGSCAPGIGFTVEDSTGTATDLYAGLPFLCPRRDSHDIEPGETDVVDWDWVPQARGSYFVRSVVRVVDGPTIRSSPVEVRVVDRP